MKVTILGSGDAFGSGGRRQTSFLIECNHRNVLLDCGATTMMALDAVQCDPNTISAIVLSHLHGDHFSGVIWFLLHARHVAKRTEPLVIVGPRGTEERIFSTGELLFPGFAEKRPDFEVNFLEHSEISPLDLSGLSVSAFEVVHPCAAPPYALRLEADGAVLAFSGDTRWTDNLIHASANADLFLCECYGFQGRNPVHLTWEVLKEKLPQITAKRILLTHMGPEMLMKASHLGVDRVGVCQDNAVVQL